jgi:carboxymethylenebutenolidase
MYGSDSPIDELVHLYVDGAISRRDLVRRVAKQTGSVAAALTALAGFEDLRAQTPPQACPADVRVPADAPDLVTSDVTFPSDDGARLFGYQAWPKNFTALLPGVIVVHENRGLVEHIRDVTRRIARAGFVGVAVDLLSRQGGVGQFPEPMQQSQAYGRTNQLERRMDLLGTLAYIKTIPVIQFDRIGMVGFCAGGGNVWDFVINIEELGAAVPYYGAPTPAPDDVAKIKTPVLAIYAERDRGLTMRLLPVANAMLEQQKVFGMFVYEGVGHAFNNDTGPNYDATAACDAWSRTIAFFNRHLRRPRE